MFGSICKMSQLTEIKLQESCVCDKSNVTCSKRAQFNAALKQLKASVVLLLCPRQDAASNYHVHGSQLLKGILTSECECWVFYIGVVLFTFIKVMFCLRSPHCIFIYLYTIKIHLYVCIINYCVLCTTYVRCLIICAAKQRLKMIVFIC